MTRLLVGAVIVLAWPIGALGTTLRVPEDYASIQAAIDATSPAQRDTVSLAAGTYRQRVLIRKSLVLRGRAGAEQTVIDGDFLGNVITVNGVDRSCVLEDLTVTGGNATHPDSVGAAIFLHSFASPTIQRCRLVGNRARAGGGINAYVYCEPLVKDCWIANNEGGAVVVESDNPMGTTFAEFENCVIANNQGFAISVIHGGRAWIRNCTIAYNNADGITSRDNARIQATNNIITNNNGGGIVREDPTVCFLLLQCNDVFGNGLGDYRGANPNDTCFTGRGSGDVSIAPCYQDAVNGNYHLLPTSPLCSLRAGCGLLGAYNDPCSGTIELCTTSVEQATWSGMKRLYR